MAVRITGVEKAKFELSGEPYKFARLIMLSADRRLVRSNPVDTGRSRSSWLPSVNASRDDSIIAEKDAAPSSIKRPPGETPDVIYPLESPVPIKLFLTNNVNYIEKLNEGHSPQAPAGFVQAAVIRAVRDVKKGTTQR
jgi:hypothetical protein